MKINDAKQKLIDSIKNLKKKILDASKEHPDLVKEKKTSVAYELAKAKEKINSTAHYKELRDIVVDILEKSPQTKAKEYLNQIKFEFDKKVARDPRLGGYNELYWYQQLLMFVYNIMLKADNLGSPDVKETTDSRERIKIIHDRANRKVLNDSMFKDVKDGYGKFAFKEILSKFKTTLNSDEIDIWPESWIAKGENSKLVFFSFVAANITKEEFERKIRSCLPVDTELKINYVQQRESAYDYLLLPVSKKHLYELSDILDKEFGEIYDIEYDEKTYEITLTVWEDKVDDLDKMLYRIASFLDKELSTRNLNWSASKSKVMGNKIIFGLPDVSTATKNASFDVILLGVKEWSKEDKRKFIDLDEFMTKDSKKMLKDAGDEIDELILLLGKAHDNIIEALDLAESLENEDKVASSLRYELEDREADLSDLDFNGEADARKAFLARFATESEEDEDFDEEE